MGDIFSAELKASIADYGQRMRKADPDDAQTFQLLPQDRKDEQLLRAVVRGNQERAQKCLAGGASADARDPHTGMTCLMYAMFAVDAPMADLLINANANVNAVDKQNLSVVSHAIIAAAHILRPEAGQRHHMAAKIVSNPAYDLGALVTTSIDTKPVTITEFQQQLKDDHVLGDAIKKRQSFVVTARQVPKSAQPG